MEILALEKNIYRQMVMHPRHFAALFIETLITFTIRDHSTTRTNRP